MASCAILSDTVSPGDARDSIAIRTLDVEIFNDERKRRFGLELSRGRRPLLGWRSDNRDGELLARNPRT